MKENKFKQVMKNLDQFRSAKYGKITLTKEQKEFLIACRNNVQPVTWIKIAELWKEIGWGDLSETSIRHRYKLVKAK